MNAFRFRMTGRFAFALMALLLGTAATAASDSEWKEDAPTAAPAFQRDRLLRLDVSASSDLRYGIDPATLTLGRDGVVRYVLVVTSPSGALNAAYDGVHCGRGEVKTYARWSPGTSSESGHWILAGQAEWRSLFSGYATRPALVLARAALCDGTATNGNPERMLRDLRQGR
jgi:CNP1-like family